MQRFDNPDVIITDVLSGHGKWRAGKSAIIYGDSRLTWKDFNRHINQVANGLIELGLKKGDRVSLLMSNRPEALEILFGAIRAGGVIVPLSVMVPGDSLAGMVVDSDSRFLFVDSDRRQVMDPFRGQFKQIAPDRFISPGPEDGAWKSYSQFLDGNPDHDPGVSLVYEDSINIMYTSGTTGTPKGILHTHHNRLQFALSFGMDLRIDSGAVTIIATALYANGTWLTMIPTLFAGGTLVLMPKFDPQEFMALVEKERCTHAFMVPTQFTMVLEQPNFGRYDLNSVRIWLTAGSPFRAQTKQDVLQRFPGELIELWGLTEGVATTLKPEDMQRKTDSVGIPLVGWDVRIIDDQGRELPSGEVGEIVAVSAWLMPEYYKLADKTAEAIWMNERGRTYLRTGDMGKLDEDGFLYVVDRKKDMIISGGINVFASDLEQVISRHPAVKDVAVIGFTHEKWGETPVAIVILKVGTAVAEKELLDSINPKLAKYQRLTKIIFREEDFPRNALGKVLKRELREAYR